MSDRPQQPDDAALLLEFLRGRDVPCPRCGYNLRDLAVPRCPECREDLSLSVGFRKPRFGWFLATVAPGIFAGISAGFLLMPIFFSSLGGGPPPWPVFVADGFGLTSGLATLLLVRWRHAFLLWPEDRQRAWAITFWTVHVGAFFILLALASAA